MILAFATIAVLVGTRMALPSAVTMAALFLAPLRQSLGRAAAAVAIVALAVVALVTGSSPPAAARPEPPTIISTLGHTGGHAGRHCVPCFAPCDIRLSKR